MREGEKQQERVGQTKVQAVYHVLLLLYFVRPFLTLYMFIGDYTAPLLHNSSSSTYSVPQTSRRAYAPALLSPIVVQQRVYNIVLLYSSDTIY